MEDKHYLTKRQKSIIAVTLAVFGFVIIMSLVFGGIFSDWKNAGITGAVIGLDDNADALAETNDQIKNIASQEGVSPELKDAIDKQTQQIKDLQNNTDTATRLLGGGGSNIVPIYVNPYY